MKGWLSGLLRYPRRESRTIAVIATLMLANVGAGLLAPWPLKLIVDSVLEGNPMPAQASWILTLPWTQTNTALLMWLAAATVFLYAARQAISILRSYIQVGCSNRMVYSLGSDIFESVLRQSVLFHSKRSTGDLVRRITADTKCVKEIVMAVALPAFTAVATLVGMFFIIWQLNPELALFALALSLPLTYIILKFIEPISVKNYAEQQLQGRMLAHAEQVLTTIPVIQLFGQERRELTRYRDLADQTIAANMGAEILGQKFTVSAGSVNAMATASAMIVGGFAVVEGELTVGSLLVLMAYFSQLYSPLETLAYLSTSYASAKAGAKRIFEVMNETETQIRSLPAAEPISVSGQNGAAIRLEHVTFGYEKGQPVLRDITLDIGMGETVAIIGPTGSGKTTLAALLARLIDPWSGAVFIEGQDIKEVSLSSVRASISIVMQEPLLLPLTIRENIAFGWPEASDSDIREAARLASADGFISGLPAGYDSVIGERGTTLSGGQRQRLSIARAILKKAPILILDEPTSDLDAMTEGSIVETISLLSKNATVILIAHRMSTARVADKILALENGVVVQYGDAKSLLDQEGMYKMFSDLQVKGDN